MEFDTNTRPAIGNPPISQCSIPIKRAHFPTHTVCWWTIHHQSWDPGRVMGAGVVRGSIRGASVVRRDPVDSADAAG